MSYTPTPSVADGEEIIVDGDMALRDATIIVPIAGRKGKVASALKLTDDGLLVATPYMIDVLESILKELKTANRALAYIVDADLTDGSE